MNDKHCSKCVDKKKPLATTKICYECFMEKDELGKLKSDKTIRCPECNSENGSFMCGECGHSEVSVG